MRSSGTKQHEMKMSDFESVRPRICPDFFTSPYPTLSLKKYLTSFSLSPASHQHRQPRPAPSWLSGTRTPRCSSSGRSHVKKTMLWATTCITASSANKTGTPSTTSLSPAPGTRRAASLRRRGANKKASWMPPMTNIYWNVYLPGQIHCPWTGDREGVRVSGQVCQPSGKQHLLRRVRTHSRQGCHSWVRLSAVLCCWDCSCTTWFHWGKGGMIMLLSDGHWEWRTNLNNQSCLQRKEICKRGSKFSHFSPI